MTKEEEPVEVVVVSADDSADSMRRYLKTHCPPTWLLAQSEAATERLKKQFSVTGTPTLVAVSASSSRPLTTAARGEVTERGVAVFREWLAIAKAEKTSLDHS